MSIVLAAIDSSAAARPVLETALRMGQLTDTGVEAVHVRSDRFGSVETAESLAARSEVPFRVLEGPVEPALLDAMGMSEVLVGIVGARATTSGRRPVGRTTRHIIEHVDKPVVVVPPEVITPGPLRRLLVPLEGTKASSQPVLERLWPLLSADVEVIVLHVFTDAHRPAMLDHPVRDLGLLGREFLKRHFPLATDIELRTGPVAMRVAEVSGERASDLIVLSWSQDRSDERANVVREVLGASSLPVLLLPIRLSQVEDAVEASPGETRPGIASD